MLSDWLKRKKEKKTDPLKYHTKKNVELRFYNNNERLTRLCERDRCAFEKRGRARPNTNRGHSKTVRTGPKREGKNEFLFEKVRNIRFL